MSEGTEQLAPLLQGAVMGPILVGLVASVALVTGTAAAITVAALFPPSGLTLAVSSVVGGVGGAAGLTWAFADAFGGRRLDSMWRFVGVLALALVAGASAVLWELTWGPLWTSTPVGAGAIPVGLCAAALAGGALLAAPLGDEGPA